MRSASIPSLDGIRAISIALVILSHAAGFEKGRSFLYKLLCFHGPLGVRIFFVISGFLITTLLMKERSSVGVISLAKFYARRAIRILPAFLAYVAAVFLLRQFGVISFASADLAYALTYTVNYAPAMSWWLGHLWSLSVEEQFYLLWPLMMRLFSLRICAGIAAVSIFLGVLVGLFHRATGVTLAQGTAFPLVCGSIASGCLGALFYPKIRHTLESLWVALVCVAGLPFVFYFDTVFTGSWSRLVLIVSDLILTLCVLRLVTVYDGPVGKLLNSKPLVWIGKLSYSLYLWQELFWNPAQPLGSAVLSLALTLGCAMLSFYLLELPLMKLRKQLSPVGKVSEPAQGELANA